jgi:amino acid permease
MRSASFSGVHVPDIRPSQRQSFAGRISHRVALGLSFANPSLAEARSGTLVGTTINTLCSVIGAGVLSLPLALYHSSVLVGLGLLLFLSFFAAFSVYLLVVGCDATGRYSITEVVAFALYPPQLWEEYLYQKGRVQTSVSPALRSAPGGGGTRTASNASGGLRTQPRRGRSGEDSGSSSAQAGGVSAEAAGPATESVGSSFTPEAPSTPYVSHAATVRGTDNNMEQQHPAASTTAPDSKGSCRRSHRHHQAAAHYGTNRSNSSSSNAQAGGTEDDDDSNYYGFTSTSAYAGLRDAYARQEWHHRRCRRIVTVLMEVVVFCSNYGTLVIYAKVIADSMPPVVSYVLHTDGIFTSKNFWLVAGGVVFFVLSCARNMEELKWSSLLGFLTIFYLVLMILYRYHTHRVSDYPHVDPSNYGSIHWLRFSVKMLQTISTFGLAFSYHYNVPYFYKELQDRRPRRMMESIAIAFPVIIACYALTGVFGYLTFGNEVANKRVGGNIVSNYPKNDVPMNIGRLGLFAHFACVFPVVSICTRRGLHRLTMIALTWAEQSALMREAAVAAGAILTDEEAGRATGAPAEAAGSASAAPTVGETSPLLRTSSNAPLPSGYEVFASSSPQQNANWLASGGARGPIATPTPISTVATSSLPPLALTASGGHAYHSLPFSTNTAEQGEQSHLTQDGGPPGTVDVDRDVGSPDLTTTLATVIEAAILVLTTVLIAGTVSGIDFVIHIIGTLFSVFIVMVAPGVVGWCVFSPNGPFGSATAAAVAYSTQQQQQQGYISDVGTGTVRSSDVAVNCAASRYRFIRLKQAMCVVDAVLGMFITCVGVSVLVYDMVKGPHTPTL